MPVSKQRRRPEAATKEHGAGAEAPRRAIRTIDDLRQALGAIETDFAAKTVAAGVWWFEQLLRRAGDEWSTVRSGKDRMRAAMLLCVAMDGAQGQNDDLAPAIAAMLRPYCPAPSFAEGWEQAKRLPPGTVRAAAARIVQASGKPAGQVPQGQQGRSG
jgi:hypothetical protein